MTASASGATVRIAAQAKINLHLRVLAREQSGFHSIETIFHRIDLADDVTVESTTGERTIDVEGVGTGPPESNLAFRAAAAYAAQKGWPVGFRITLKKRIPVGAGLGGGSADAAAVLRALDSVSPDPIGSHGLLQIAATLGSDVPFLTSDAVMALAWGRGEQMLACAPLPRKDVLLLIPDFSVSTADAYGWFDARRDEVENSVPFVTDALSLSSWESVVRFARNDFEAPVMARHPRLAEYLDELRQSRAILARMTGSGSALFAVFDSPPPDAHVSDENRRRVIQTMTSIDIVQPTRVG